MQQGVVETLLEHGYLPVVSPVSRGPDGGAPWPLGQYLDSARTLTGQLDVALDDLGFMRVASEELTQFDGRLRGRMNLSGTLAQDDAGALVSDGDAAAQTRRMLHQLPSALRIDGTYRARELPSRALMRRLGRLRICALQRLENAFEMALRDRQPARHHLARVLRHAQPAAVSSTPMQNTR